MQIRMMSHGQCPDNNCYVYRRYYLTINISAASPTIESQIEALIPQTTDAVGFALWTGIFAGVVAGIVTAILMWLCKEVYVKSIKPNIANMLYRDAEVAGRWKAEFSYASLDEHRLDEFASNVRKNERHKIMKELNEVAKLAKQKKEKEINPSPETNEVPETENKATIESKKNTAVIKKRAKPSNEFAVTLKRQGHNITGTMLCTKGHNEGRHYTLLGTFKNLILTGTYESTDTNEIERGTISLMLKHNGKCLNGHLVALSDEAHELRSLRTNWIRK
jgi:hypothetical protein